VLNHGEMGIWRNGNSEDGPIHHSAQQKTTTQPEGSKWGKKSVNFDHEIKKLALKKFAQIQSTCFM
jgi:hypothetical protein